MKSSDYQSLLNNKIMKERSRLLILSYLASSENNSATFMVLQKALDLSRGNLSVQIQKLNDVDYISINKDFHENKPRTTAKITKVGITALKTYLAEMEQIINSVNKI